MKKSLLLFLFAAGIAFSGRTQDLYLQAGDVQTFEFDNFAFQFQIPPGSTYNPLTRLLIGKQNFSGSFLVEAFENSTSETPVFSETVDPTTTSVFYFGPSWEDFQGVARITMLSGSMDLTVILATVTTPSQDVYAQTIIPAPEPAAWLIGLAAVPALWITRRRNAT